ncbi:7534_t:CDS:2 [Ambispora leptoticha]|uniref:7534_t:CDS:1 n=1 Tax=Ambispora leptoticha TaxID=144679 RepID=A0A9N9GV10_9GLOM|nr:7534_t:CDS:2 [Ambispora leptoticha]
MAQPYRIQDRRSGDRISRTTSSKNSGQSDVIRFSVEEAEETSMNSNEPAPTVEENQHPLLNNSEEQVPPENSNNSSQNVTQNAIKHIYINLVDDNEENEENEGQTEIIYISDEELDYNNEEAPDYDNIKPNVKQKFAEEFIYTARYILKLKKNANIHHYHVKDSQQIWIKIRL